MDKLYETAEKYSRLLELADEENQPENMKEAIETTLAVIEDDFKTKGINIAKINREFDFNIKSLKEEEDRLRKRRKSIEACQERLKDYLRFNMEKCEISKIKSELFTISLSEKPSKILFIEDGCRIPFKYFEFTQKLKTDEIKKELLLNREIPGAILKDGKRRLTIR